jgi:hypothetical protein
MQKSGTYPYLSAAYEFAFLRPDLVEPVLRRNLDKIDSFTWISFERMRSAQFEVDRYSTELSDTSGVLFRTNSLRIYAVTPYIFETCTSEEFHQFLSLHYTLFPGYKRVGEVLYSRAGS